MSIDLDAIEAALVPVYDEYGRGASEWHDNIEVRARTEWLPALISELRSRRKRDVLLNAVAEAARDYLGADAAMQSDPSALSVRITAFDRWQSARTTAYAALAALDALDAGGEA